MDIWKICESITSKTNWYNKVFNEDIISKWKKEINSDDEFDFALALLQASAKGSHISKKCKWTDEETCMKCVENVKKQITANPKKWGYRLKELNDLTFDDLDWYYDTDPDPDCDHIRCKCSAPCSDLNDYIEYHPNGLIGKKLHQKCKLIISEMAENEPIDWHPGSNNQVRDIIHPSMYPYIAGVSTHKNGLIDAKCEENIQYQWLPSNFKIDPNGKVKVASYINNLKSKKYPEFIPLIENVFETYIPSLENILNEQLSDRTLQVIVKVGSIILNADNNKYPGGSWHIEGMPQEHIIATCIHYVDADNITDSFLEFRKPTIINQDNINYPQSDQGYTRHHYGLDGHFEGNMNKYLGLIKCTEGSDIIFPNSLQHRVKDFNLTKGAGLRTILAFFVIDPNHKIISTKDIPQQQKLFTIEEANYHRERLMYHRKYFVDKLNKKVFEREFSLCEH